MKLLKIILMFALSMFFVVNVTAQQENAVNVKPFKCSSKKVKVCPDTIVALSQYVLDTTALKEQIRNLEQQAVNFEIDKFLNIEDETIFNSSFKDCDLKKIHPRSCDYYLLIKNIHVLNEYLAKIERDLSNTNVEKVVKEMNLSNETVKSIFLESAKKDIDMAEQKLVDIIPFAKGIDFLSLQQKQYYKLLKDKFNELYNQIYPNE